MNNPSLSAILLVALSFSLTVARAQTPCEGCGTQVGGVIAVQEWTKAGSPYCVTNDLLIAGLTIREGVEVRVCGNYVLDVLTPIVVEGTADEPVHFHPGDPAVGWQGLLFRDTGPGSYFVHAIIEGSKSSGIRLTNSPLALTNCWIINNSSSDRGGGVSASLRTESLVFDRCVISTNSSRSHGGGISAAIDSGRLLFQRCSIEANVSNPTQSGEGHVGGGIYVSGGDGAEVIMDQCTISRNECLNRHAPQTGNPVRSRGGGAYLNLAGSGRALMRNCWISRNVVFAQETHTFNFNSPAQSWGGGVYLAAGELLVMNSFVVENESNALAHGDPIQPRGAGLYIGGGRARLINCTLSQNNTQSLYLGSGESGVLNCIAWNNNSGGAQVTGTVTVEYSCVQGGHTGEGNIMSNPALCPDRLSLLPTSLCIDAGHPGLAYRDSCIDNTVCSTYARGTTRNDMGAYGGPCVAGWNPPCPAPVIVSSPRNTMALEGFDASLPVEATDEQNLTYLWFKDGMPLDRETNSVFRIEPIALGHAGLYNVEAFNGRASAISPTSQLMVTDVLVQARLNEEGHVELTIRPASPPQTLVVEFASEAHDLAAPTNWTTVDTLEAIEDTLSWTESTPASESARFYRVVRQE